jgi:hypothetical protein
MTFIRACEHITNYSAAHESRRHLVGEERLAYPANHIEADNRLAWFTGRLDRVYGDEPTYVYLRRDMDKVVASYIERFDLGILRAYRRQILWKVPHDSDPETIARDYVETMSANIELFLRDKSKVMDFQLENAKAEFPAFWERIGAQGDLEAALAVFDTRHNSTADTVARWEPKPSRGKPEPNRGKPKPTRGRGRLWKR